MEKGKRRSVLDREFLGIELRYWLISITCWVLMAVFLYLMFVLTSIEYNLLFSTISTILGLTSVLSLFQSATRKDMRMLRQDIQLLRKEISQGFESVESVLKQMLEEVRR